MGALLDEALGNQPQAAPQAPPSAPTPQAANVDVGRLQADQAFRNLSPAAQQRILDSLGARSPATPGLGLANETPPSQPGGPPPDMPINSAVPRELKAALIDPTYRLLSGKSQGVMGTASDALSTGQLVGAGVATALGGPVAGGAVLLAPTVGATVRGVLTDFNAGQGWTNFLGGLAEIGVGGVQGLAGWRKAMGTARGLVGEAEAAGAIGEAGAGQVRAQQNIARSIIDRANNAFEIRARPISRVIDGAEATAAKLTVARGNPVFDDVSYLVDQAKKLRVTAPELVKLEKDLQAGTVNMKDVVELRKELENSLSYAKSLSDPNVPSNPKLATQVRGYATDAIMHSLGNEAGGRYGEALLAWRTQVSDPKRILETVLSKNLEPSTAFEIVYGGSTPPEVLQTLSSLRDVDPTFRATLRLGAMQHFLAASGGNLSRSADAAKAFKTLGPMLATTGLFSDEEMTSLKLFMRPGMIDEAMNRLGQAVTGKPARIAALGFAAGLGEHSGSAIYHLAAAHPQLAFTAIAATGGLSLLRRVYLAPPGSAAATASALGITRGLAELGGQLANRPSVETTR